MAKDVTATHPDYAAFLPDWKLVADASAGERAVKDREDTYLPRPNPSDKSEQNRTRYEQYKKRAVYYNATGRTLSGLTGLAFRRWPEVEIAPQLEQFSEDATGSGVPLVQHSLTTLNEVLKSGRAGVLVDYPQTSGQVSRAQQLEGGVQPTLTLYPATAITNWRTMKRGSKTILSLVVLMETHEEVGEFETKQVTQYRELRLLDEGYIVRLWRKSKDDLGHESWVVQSTATPTNGKGQRWNVIPFQFVGSVSNDAGIDPSPLLDIATLNIAHYRNSADYEESAYMLGQGQVWMAGLDEQWVKMLDDKGIYFGSRAILPLPTGGSAGLIQVQPNTLCKEAMDQKEEQMAALGARLVTAGSANARTATEVNSDDANSHSVLSLCCDNVSNAYKQLLAWAQDFANADGEVEFSISTEFTSIIVDPAMLRELLSAVQAGKVPESDFWTALRNAGLIDSEKDDDAIREELSTQTPPATGNALDDDPEDDVVDDEEA